MDTRTLWIGAAVLVLAAGCNRSDRQTGSVLDNDNDRQARITVTGCLQPAEQGLASREPNSASRSAEGIDRFILANAAPATQSSSSSPSSSESSPSAAAATGPLYLLEGDKDQLRQHVGQQVEVTGKPDDDSSSSDPNQPNAQRLEVESMRMIAQNCATR
jgi:hypothetical protein